MELLRMKERPDVVHVHYAMYFALPADLFNIITRTLYVISCHGANVRSLGKRWPSRFIQKSFFGRAAVVTAASRELQAVLFSKYCFGEQKVLVVSNGVDASEIAEALASAEPRGAGRMEIAFLANARPVKDPLGALSAFGAALKERPELHMTVIGGGELYPQLREAAKKENLDASVTLTGELPHREALEKLRGATSSCSRPGRRGEPAGPDGAMAMGKAIVATDVGGIKDLVTNRLNGLLIRRGTPGSSRTRWSRWAGTPPSQELWLRRRRARQLGSLGTPWIASKRLSTLVLALNLENRPLSNNQFQSPWKGYTAV